MEKGTIIFETGDFPGKGSGKGKGEQREEDRTDNHYLARAPSAAVIYSSFGSNFVLVPTRDYPTLMRAGVGGGARGCAAPDAAACCLVSTSAVLAALATVLLL